MILIYVDDKYSHDPFFHTGTEVIEPYTSTTVNRCTCRECRIIVS